MQPELETSIVSVEGVEEEVTSHELGLKGNLDVKIEADLSPNGLSRSRHTMGIELKTNHNTNTQNNHVVQLAFYNIMLLARNGHTASDALLKRNPDSSDPITGGILLYINDESRRAIHVAPQLNEIKCLLEQRNTFCTQAIRASKPRGVSLSYKGDEEPQLCVSVLSARSKLYGSRRKPYTHVQVFRVAFTESWRTTRLPQICHPCNIQASVQGVIRHGSAWSTQQLRKETRRIAANHTKNY